MVLPVILIYMAVLYLYELYDFNVFLIDDTIKIALRYGKAIVLIYCKDRV